MLSLKEKLAILTGKGGWHTNSLGGKAPQLLLCDGTETIPGKTFG